jgi:hypothetical protein
MASTWILMVLMSAYVITMMTIGKRMSGLPGGNFLGKFHVADIGVSIPTFKL